MKRRIAFAFFLALALMLPSGVAAQVGEPFTLALTGDSIIMQRLSVFKEPEFTRLFDLIRGADAAFTNLETLFHDYEMPPAHESGGTWMRTDPPILKELVWAGFDLVSRANNHAGDFGVARRADHQPLRARRRARRSRRRQQPRRSARSEVPRDAEGPRRVDLGGVDVHAAFARRQHARRHAGAAGIEPAAVHDHLHVTPERLADLRRVAAELSGNPPGSGRHVEFRRPPLRRRPKPGTHTEPNKQDVEEIARVVKSAAALADIVIVSLHCHESGANRSVPADFIPIFAKAVIDAGADVFVGHGPHVLRGIEIYKGKPIFYSLSNFIFQNETVLRMPEDSYEQYSLGDDAQPADYLDARYDKDRRSFPADREYWDSVAVMTKWEGGKFVEAAAASDHARIPDAAVRARPPEARLRRGCRAHSGDDDDALKGVRRDGDDQERRRDRDAVTRHYREVDGESVSVPGWNDRQLCQYSCDAATGLSAGADPERSRPAKS